MIGGLVPAEPTAITPTRRETAYAYYTVHHRASLHRRYCPQCRSCLGGPPHR